MRTGSIHPLDKYRRPGTKYTTCAGCGNGIIAQSTLRAVDRLGLDFDRMVFVSGIGCAGWIPSPAFNTDVLHVTHGRAIPAAMGVKLAAPHLEVVIFSGDGDLAAIGGNHFIHAARRNLDLTVICVNNRIYGMTGGQAAPTTPVSLPTTTTPAGNLEHEFDLVRLAEAAGASFVARWTTYQARAMSRSIGRALERNGFSFVEVVSQCPVQYGKMVGMRDDAVAMMRELKEKSVRREESEKLDAEKLRDRIVVGEFVDSEYRPELTAQMEKVRKKLAMEAGNDEP